MLDIIFIQYTLYTNFPLCTHFSSICIDKPHEFYSPRFKHGTNHWIFLCIEHFENARTGLKYAFFLSLCIVPSRLNEHFVKIRVETEDWNIGFFTAISMFIIPSCLQHSRTIKPELYWNILNYKPNLSLYRTKWAAYAIKKDSNKKLCFSKCQVKVWRFVFKHCYKNSSTRR